MLRAQQALPDDQGLLEQRDRLGRAARRLVGGGQAVPRVQRVRMVGAQQPLKVRGQRLADRDGLRRAVAELDQVIERQEPEPQQDPGQLLIGLAGRLGRLGQRRHLLGDVPDGRAIRRSGQRPRPGFQQRGGAPADLRQPPRGQSVPDDPRHQAVGDDGLAVQAESQQRPVGQLVQRRVHHGGRLAPAQHARLPGGMQQVPADPGPGQHRDELHRPVAAPAGTASRDSRTARAVPAGPPRPAAPAAGPGTRRIRDCPAAISAAASASASGRCPSSAATAPAAASSPGRCARPGKPAPPPQRTRQPGRAAPGPTPGGW